MAVLAPFRQVATDTRSRATGIQCRNVLGMRVDATSYAEATDRILRWTSDGGARYVCVANVHMTMEAADDPSFQRLVNDAELVVPDGMPLVWALRTLGIRDASRVYGPDLMLQVCEAAARQGTPVGLYGGRPEGLDVLRTYLETRFPGLRIAYASSPPYRTLTEAEDADVVDEIVASGARILFVGLGCPKQERWMLAHRDRLPLVQIGVGAAFDFHAGLVRQAPGWLQAAGLEWAFRMAMEPARLARRYLRHNPRFVAGFARQWLQARWQASVSPRA